MSVGLRAVRARFESDYLDLTIAKYASPLHIEADLYILIDITSTGDLQQHVCGAAAAVRGRRISYHESP